MHNKFLYLQNEIYYLQNEIYYLQIKLFSFICIIKYLVLLFYLTRTVCLNIILFTLVTLFILEFILEWICIN